MNDRQIYKKAAQLLETGQNIALVTVISTTGSTPGKVGYKMLVWGENARILGTVGGGSNEAEMITSAKNLLPKTQTRLYSFTLDGIPAGQKPICGGSTELLIETFDNNSLPLFKDLSTAYNLPSAAIISMISPEQPSKKILLKDTYRPDSFSSLNLPPETIESVKQIVASQQTTKTTLPDGTQIFVETLSQQPKLLIFGAGHLACHISKYAKSVNFRVTVWDDRPEFANKDRFPDADNIIVDHYENVFGQLDTSDISYIVIVTKGHKSDQTILEKALKTNAKYIGMIGSRRKASAVLNQLKESKGPQQALNRIYSPIGISIGALTPEEIALSIVAELVKIRRLGPAPKLTHMTVSSSTNLDDQNL
jgi:xanthine dehydrogenase accessory factor